MRILIVDDDVPTRVGLRAILSAESDMEVVGEASSSAEAMQMEASLAPDVILMDIRLPDLDGIEATRRILAAAKQRGRVVRVLMLTTFEFDEYTYRSILAGASGFLLKRTRAEELVAAVRAVSEGTSLPVADKTRDMIGHFTAPLSQVPPIRFNPPLTSRESEVLALIARGYSNSEIADQLFVSLDTVKTHVKHVYLKSGARDRAHAVIIAYESGLVTRSEEPRA